MKMSIMLALQGEGKTKIDLHNGNPVFIFEDKFVDFNKVEVPYQFLESVMPRGSLHMNKMLYCIYTMGTEWVFAAYYDHKAFMFFINIK